MLDKDESIFGLSPSVEDERPMIDFEFIEHRQIDWLRIDEVLRGLRPLSDYPSVALSVPRKDATSWAFYLVPGTLGLIAKKAVDALGAETFRLYDLLSASLNGTKYYFLKCREVLPCLDLSRSTTVRFGCDPTRIKAIEKYAFVKAIITDPLIFSIPELPALFATPGVERRVRDTELRGFCFDKVD